MLRDRVEYGARLGQSEPHADRRVVGGADHQERHAVELHGTAQYVAVLLDAVVGPE